MKELKVMMSFLLLSLGCLTISAQQEVLTKEFRGERSKAGEATIWQSQRYAKDGLGCTSFEVDIPSSGNYFVNFWMIPTQEPSGEPSNYTVEVNGKTIADKIIPTKCDWQSVGISSKKPFHLNAGRNTIAVLGKLPFLPEVETIRLSSSIDDAVISSEKYDEFKKKILSGATDLQTESSSSSRSSSFPIYGLWQLGASISYTFTTTLYLSAWTLYNISSSSNSNYAHYLEVFSEPNQSNSYRVLSSGGQATISNIQSSTGGIYVVRVRSSHHSTTSTATVSVNGGSQYTNVPITNYEISYSQPTDNEYNSFLCYKSGNGDPYLDLMSYSSNKVYLARNDDGSSYSGDFTWGDCPRIKTQLSISSDAALVFTNSSLYPTCTADIYLGFPNLSDISAIVDSFPNFKNGDAIASAPHSGVYRCAAWAVGIWDHSRWPPQESPSDYPEYANCNSDLDRFDVFFGNFGYTRNGATESNSIIDLWKQSVFFTHVSVRKNTNSDNYPHGYSWESKIGTFPRTFHPRYALEGNKYGQVSYYYINNPNSTMGQSLFENVAEGIMTIENVSFNESEISYINNAIQKIPSYISKELMERYKKWVAVASSSYQSSISSMKNCEEYRSLYNYCDQHRDTRFILFKLLDEDEEMVTYLIRDLLYDKNQKVLEKLKEENLRVTKMGDAIIYRKPITNVIKFVKFLFSTEDASSQPVAKGISSDLSYSSKKSFALTKTGRSIEVSFSLKEDAKISLLLYNLNGVIIDNPLNNKQLNSGHHNYSIILKDSGTYLVVYKENGTTSVKKVIID